MAETSALAEFAGRTSFDDLPEHAVSRATEALLDVLGVAFYGSRQPVGDLVSRYVAATAPGDDATVLGVGTASLPGAALANGTFAHATDFDDTFLGRPVVHPSAPVLPAVLAAAERDAASGREVLTGYAVGLEVIRRVGAAVAPGHYERGWHSTGTIGTFGAAAGAASVLGLSPAATERALGVAASSSSALKAGNFGTMLKPLHAGHAASMGVRAALLAESGLTADEAVLEGPFGYGAVMTPGEYDPAAITDGLGETWSGLSIKRKCYPCGSYSQGMLEALRTLVEREALAVADVAALELTYPFPRASGNSTDSARPATALEAKVSRPFLAATMLVDGDLGLRHFEEFALREEVRAAMDRVTVRHDPDRFPDGGTHPHGRSAGHVRVETVDGDVFAEMEPYSPDSPENPVDDDRWRAKFDACAGAAVSAADAAAIRQAVAEIEDADGGEESSFLARLRRHATPGR